MAATSWQDKVTPIGFDGLTVLWCMVLTLLAVTYQPELGLLALAFGGGRFAIRAFDLRTRWSLDAASLLVVVYFLLVGIPFVSALMIFQIIAVRVGVRFARNPENQPKKLGAVTGSAEVRRSAKRALRRRPEQKGTYAARWADEADLAENNMYIESDERFGRNLALGVRDGHLIGIKEGHADRGELGHFLVAGATRAGKGRMLTANALMWPESLVVLDIKGENYAQTAGQRAEYSRILALHPNGKGHRYDPFAEMRHSNEGMRTAANIIIASHQDKQPVFGQTAENALYAAFLGARLEDAPTLPYLQALLDEGVLGFVQHLASLNDRVVNRALTQFLTVKPSDFTLGFFEQSGLLRGAWGTLNTRCSAFMTDGVMAMMSGSDFKAADLFDQNTSLYLIFPESEAAATSKAFQVIMISLVNSLIRDYDERAAEGEKPTRQSLWLLDEAGRTPIPNLDTYIATVAGRGMVFGLFLQDLPQLYENYQVAEKTVRSNIRTQVFYTPTEETTAKHVEMRLGQHSIVHERQHWEEVDLVVTSIPVVTETEIVRESHRSLMTTDELYQMPLNDVIVFAAATPPIYARRVEPNEVFDDLDQLPKAPALAKLEAVDYVLKARTPTPATPIPAPNQNAPDQQPAPTRETQSSPGDPEF